MRSRSMRRDAGETGIARFGVLTFSIGGVFANKGAGAKRGVIFATSFFGRVTTVEEETLAVSTGLASTIFGLREYSRGAESEAQRKLLRCATRGLFCGIVARVREVNARSTGRDFTRSTVLCIDVVSCGSATETRRDAINDAPTRVREYLRETSTAPSNRGAGAMFFADAAGSGTARARGENEAPKAAAERKAKDR